MDIIANDENRGEQSADTSIFGPDCQPDEENAEGKREESNHVNNSTIIDSDSSLNQREKPYAENKQDANASPLERGSAQNENNEMSDNSNSLVPKYDTKEIENLNIVNEGKSPSSSISEVLDVDNASELGDSDINSDLTQDVLPKALSASRCEEQDLGVDAPTATHIGTKVEETLQRDEIETEKSKADETENNRELVEELRQKLENCQKLQTQYDSEQLLKRIKSQDDQISELKQALITKQKAVDDAREEHESLSLRLSCMTEEEKESNIKLKQMQERLEELETQITELTSSSGNATQSQNLSADLENGDASNRSQTRTASSDDEIKRSDAEPGRRKHTTGRSSKICLLL